MTDKKLTVRWGEKTVELDGDGTGIGRFKIGALHITLMRFFYLPGNKRGDKLKIYCYVNEHIVAATTGKTAQQAVNKLRRKLTAMFKAVGKALDYDVEK